MAGLRNFILSFFILTLLGYAAYSQKPGARTQADTLVEQNRDELKRTVRELTKSLTPDQYLPDSSVTKKDFIKPSRMDSIGMSYENGKLNLPGGVPSRLDENQVRKVGEEQLKKLPTNVVRPDAVVPGKESIPDENTLKSGVETKLEENSTYEKVKNYKEKHRDLIDSTSQLVRQGQEILTSGSFRKVHKVYSEKALKRIYDSLGISKLDSVLALASAKKEVSKEDLLQALNAPMPEMPLNAEPKSMSDLPGAEGISSMKDGIKSGNLGALKLPQNVLAELPPMRGFQFPSDKFSLLDSVRKMNLSRERLMLKRERITKELEEVIVKRKPKFWDKTYFEGVLSYLKFEDSNLLQVAPSLGYQIKNNFSIGLGPNVLLMEENNHWNVYIGYRTYMKMTFLSQRVYVQLEDVTDPGAIANEYLSSMKHSILAGGGVLLPISQSLALNLSVLYRVNNQSYSGGSVSPWVFRLGLSSKKSTKRNIK